MAGYNIVLNLSGNAVSRAEKLAAALGTASANATSLAASLRAVGGAASTVPARTIRVGATSGGVRGASATDYRFREYVQGMTRQSDALRSMSRYYRDLERSSRAYDRTQERIMRRTRHRSTRILSYGTGFNLGGLSGRFSTILQPDAQGKLLGMDAGRLMKGMNVAAMGTQIAGGIARFVLKNMARATIGQFATGGVGTMLMSRLLMSEGMAGGVRIIQRRNQARLGLGMAEYGRANDYADQLARDYGLERSVALSSLNVMTGLGTSNGRRLTMGNAVALTRVGGLISQQAGVPFERVMTNFQQILSQDKPNIRDIRELLNQAPILKRYAIDEIAKKGLQVDANTWLKDQGNFLNVLARYDAENSSSLIMQARGMVSVAQQDMWATLAENKDWMSVAMNASSLIKTFGESLSSLISALNNDTGFRNSVNALTGLVKLLGSNSSYLTGTISKYAGMYASFFGIDPGDVKKEGKILTQRQQVVENALENNKESLWERFKTSPAALGTDETTLRQQFETFFASQKAELATDPSVLGAVRLAAPLKNVGDYLPFSNEWNSLVFNHRQGGYENAHRTWFEASRLQMMGAQNILAKPEDQTRTIFPQSVYGVGSIPNDAFYERVIDRMFEEIRKVPKGMNGVGGDDGTNMGGLNRDRRSLTINFNDAIVKWDSTIMATDPEETVAEVRQNIDQIASEAIQKALLATTGKINTRW